MIWNLEVMKQKGDTFSVFLVDRQLVDWSHGISHVGQCFERGVAAFRLVLSKYAIECGFDFKFVKNDSLRVTAVCMLRKQKGYTWLIHRRVQTCKRLNNLHSCGAVVRTGKNSRLNSELVCNVIGDRLRDKPLTRPADVTFDLKKEHGLNISYHIAWLGVEKASSARTLTFVSDHNAGLLESFPTVFPSAHHAYCLQQLQANLRDKLRWVDNCVRFGLIAKLSECAYAPTEASFQHHLTKLKGSGRFGINNFLEDMPPNHWANAYFRDKRYGEMTSNVAESFNKWILDARNYPITRFPCAYAVIAIQNSGSDFSTCVEQIFTVDQYKAAYSRYIQPIPTVNKPSFSEDDFIIYP
ncbi:hypothetical protein ACSBR2_037557 [Camellia fascicularis]